VKEARAIIAPNNGVVGCLVKGAVVGAVGAVAVGALAVGAVTIGAPVALVTGVLGAVAVVGGVALGLDVSQQVSAGNWAGVAYDAGSVAGGAAVGLAGGGALANGIKSGATSGWSPASWIAQRFNPSLGSFGQWLKIMRQTGMEDHGRSCVRKIMRQTGMGL
jgi:hypothetical protein